MAHPARVVTPSECSSPSPKARTESSTNEPVFNELPLGTFNGSPLLIRNTFLDIRRSNTDPAASLRLGRAMSLPFLLSESVVESPPSSPTFVDVRRHAFDVRSRLLTFDCGAGAPCTYTDDQQAKSPRSLLTSSTCTPASAAQPTPTTVLLKNIPEEYTRDMLVDTLNSNGFEGRFDFLYHPMDFGTRMSFGYAFINLITHEDADEFLDTFQDFGSWSVGTDKLGDVDWSDRQGFDSLIERYRNSPLMHRKVPDEAKPIVLKDGHRAEFPEPTQPLKPLRVRQSKARKARTLGHEEIDG